MAFQEGKAFVFQFRGGRAPELLSHEEEIALAKRLERGDEEAEVELFEANVRLVINVARKYLGRGMLLADLIQEGNIGLLKAVRKFDWRRGNRFSTYASWWIRHYLNRAVGNQGSEVRLPTHVKEKIRRLLRVQASFKRRHGREPRPEEIAQAFKRGTTEVRRVIEILEQAPRFSTPILHWPQDEGERALGIDEEKLPDENSLPADEVIFLDKLKRLVDELLPQLRPVERDIVLVRLRREMTLQAIAASHGLTRERIRQIEEIVEKKIRRHLQRRLKIACLSQGGLG